MPDNYGASLIELIDRRIDQSALKPTKMGTVVSRESATALATVSFDGGSGIAQPVKCFDSVIVNQGDRVGLIKFEGDWAIVGNYTPRTLGDQFTSVQFASGNTTTSATFVDMPAGAALTIFKVKDVTQFQIRIGISGFTTVANTGFSVGANIENSDGSINTDVTLYQRAFNAAFEHHDWTGGVKTALTLPSDSYAITGRWLRRSGTGTLTMNSDNGVWIHVKEVID